MRDLFGVEVPDIPLAPARGKYEAFKRRNNYRKADGERWCGKCEYFVTIDYHNKTYFKCRWMGCSASVASDIRKFNVCDVFHKEG